MEIFESDSPTKASKVVGGYGTTCASQLKGFKEHWCEGCRRKKGCRCKDRILEDWIKLKEKLQLAKASGPPRKESIPRAVNEAFRNRGAEKREVGRRSLFQEAQRFTQEIIPNTRRTSLPKFQEKRKESRRVQYPERKKAFSVHKTFPQKRVPIKDRTRSYSPSIYNHNAKELRGRDERQSTQVDEFMIMESPAKKEGNSDVYSFKEDEDGNSGLGSTNGSEFYDSPAPRYPTATDIASVIAPMEQDDLAVVLDILKKSPLGKRFEHIQLPVSVPAPPPPETVPVSAQTVQPVHSYLIPMPQIDDFDPDMQRDLSHFNTWKELDSFQQ